MKYSVSIDVPNLDEGLKFYRDALGLAEVRRPIPTYVVLQCGDAKIGVMEKAAGSKPAKGSDDVRRHDRHWTPVRISTLMSMISTTFLMKEPSRRRCDLRAEIRHGRPPADRLLQRPFRKWLLCDWTVGQIVQAIPAQLLAKECHGPPECEAAEMTPDLCLARRSSSPTCAWFAEPHWVARTPAGQDN